MIFLKFLFCMTLLTLCCIQNSKAARWSIYGGYSSSGSWYIGFGVSWRFARFQDKLGQCVRLADGIVTRQQWAAIEPRRQIQMNSRADEIFLWQTGPDTCSLIGLTADECQDCLQDRSCTEKIVKALQDADLKEGNDDIKYNFLIDQDGVIYEGRSWGVVGQHTKGKDSHSIGVAVIGDFSKREPSRAVQEALNNLIICGKATQEVTSGALLRTTPAMSGQAFYDLLDRCDGLCLND